MSWGPIDPDWGAGWENFDVDPFAEPADGSSRRRPDRRSAPRPARRQRDRGHSARRSSGRSPRRAPGRSPRRDPGSTTPEPGPARLRAAPPPVSRPRHEAPPRRPGGRGPGGGGRGGPPPRPTVTARGRAGDPRRRALLVKVLLGLLLLAVVAKLVHVQVVEPDRFVATGQEQRLRNVTLDADRGRITDREGHNLALSVLRPSVFADPAQIDDAWSTAERLAPVLGRDPMPLAHDLSGDDRFVYLARRVDDELASQVVELDLDGIHLLEEPARFTPSGDLARSVIGRVASDQTGATGIELLHDDVLTGTPGEVTYERARDGGTIAAAGQSRVPPRAGDDVVLTIDRSLQYEAERVLTEQVDALDADGGTVVVSRPASGDVLALANITRNTDGEIITAGANRAVIDVFEPGSVNKVITIAAALEEGLVEPDTSLLVPWRHQVADHEFTDDHEHPTEPMTVTDILARSSNIGTIMLGQQLGKDRIDTYLREFGFGSRTALDFPNESGGLLLPPDRWSGTSIGSIPIGQGIAVTAMQMLEAYNVIANDGVYVEPRLVAATVDAEGNRTETEVAEARRVVSERTARQVREMLVEAVETGTGRRATVTGYSVGGKTGTARKPQDTGTYRDRAGNYHYVAAFTGMVPAENPELSIIVVIDEPTTTIYGSAAAAPVFADLATFALNRFRIPPVPGRTK